mmetsp:Transcript_20256/g.30905  ORF Transcript_20256/g.30905 Transcript_20256/m.30905 type:complete len:552 (-) Transcript_20256:256-1911(-)
MRSPRRWLVGHMQKGSITVFESFQSRRQSSHHHEKRGKHNGFIPNSMRIRSQEAWGGVCEETKLRLVDWEQAFKKAIDGISGTASVQESAEALRTLVRTGLLKYSDIKNDPPKFFAAHRLLARHAVDHGPGFWIRFSVSYNLCYGTIVANGSNAQVEAIERDQERGAIGCFALTERLAGVQSGLVVHTKALLCPETQEFVFSTPDRGAEKFWISQGSTADTCVVIADLHTRSIEKEQTISHGPHAFFIPIRDPHSFALAPRIEIGDMGVKTTGNDLDNAWIRFNDARFPTSCLLSRYCNLDLTTGVYTRDPDVHPFDLIGQRLFTGRVAVAQAALAFRREVFDRARGYAVDKSLPSKSGRKKRTLASLPQLRSLFNDAEKKAVRLEAFVDVLERRLDPLLVASLPVDADLAHCISVAKVKAVETAIELCWRLKQDLGSYALMDDAGFRHADFLICCKFAEGDSRILMQKMAKDRLKRYQHDHHRAQRNPKINAICAKLDSSLRSAELNNDARESIWDDSWQDVYHLAELIMDRTIAEVLLEDHIVHDDPGF